MYYWLCSSFISFYTHNMDFIPNYANSKPFTKDLLAFLLRGQSPPISLNKEAKGGSLYSFCTQLEKKVFLSYPFGAVKGIIPLSLRGYAPQTPQTRSPKSFSLRIYPQTPEIRKAQRLSLCASAQNKEYVFLLFPCGFAAGVALLALKLEFIYAIIIPLFLFFLHKTYINN